MTNKLLTLISLKMAERSEAKNANWKKASRQKYLKSFASDF